MRRPRTLRRPASAFPLLFLLCAPGCIARHVAISQTGLTCGEAHQAAIMAARRMGYTVKEAIKPVPGVPGMIKASRLDGTTEHGLVVSVVCTNLGAEVEARTDQGGLAEVNFPSEFRHSFETVLATRPPLRAAAEHGVDVLVTPERGNDLGALGVELANLGVLPVTVRITNHTTRSYRFTVAGVVLQTTSRERVKSLAAGDVAKQLSGEAAGLLKQKMLADHDIAPDATLNGLLLFPFKEYTRARVDLIDRASDETEGFAIEF